MSWEPATGQVGRLLLLVWLAQAKGDLETKMKLNWMEGAISQCYHPFACTTGCCWRGEGGRQVQLIEKQEGCSRLHLHHHSLGLCQDHVPDRTGRKASRCLLGKSSKWKEGQRKTLDPSVVSLAPKAIWRARQASNSACTATGSWGWIGRQRNGP